MQNIVPFIWLDGKVKAATNYYTKIFPNSKILYINKNGNGKVMWSEIEINGVQFMLFDGAMEQSFTQGISFFVRCKDQKEVDKYWNALTKDGGEEGRCGWLKDRYGISWQIIPDALSECMGNPDPEKAEKARQSMLKMKKIVVQDLYDAVK